MFADPQHDEISPPSSPAAGGQAHHGQERLAGRDGEQRPGDTEQWQVYHPSGRERVITVLSGLAISQNIIKSPAKSQLTVITLC